MRKFVPTILGRWPDDVKHIIYKDKHKGVYTLNSGKTLESIYNLNEFIKTRVIVSKSYKEEKPDYSVII